MIKTYSRSSGSKKLSNNFQVKEFACKCGKCDAVSVDTDLVEYLQKIRDHFGKPVTINSGYRCPDHNKAAGGATGSRHTKGEAADIAVQGVAPAEVAKYAECIGVLGIGLYEKPSDGYFVHIDTRNYQSFWYGHAQARWETFGGYSMKRFVMDVQKACGAKVDGIVGAETISKTITLSRYENTRHAAVKAVQKRLYALGYTEVGEADGIAGKKFAEAVARFQQDNGCVVDGEITAKNKTWRILLGMEGDA